MRTGHLHRRAPRRLGDLRRRRRSGPQLLHDPVARGARHRGRGQRHLGRRGPAQRAARGLAAPPCPGGGLHGPAARGDVRLRRRSPRPAPKRAATRCSSRRRRWPSPARPERLPGRWRSCDRAARRQDRGRHRGKLRDRPGQRRATGGRGRTRVHHRAAPGGARSGRGGDRRRDPRRRRRQRRRRRGPPLRPGARARAGPGRRLRQRGDQPHRAAGRARPRKPTTGSSTSTSRGCSSPCRRRSRCSTRARP